MLLNNKDRQILDHIVKYCDEVDLAISEYGNDKETFLNNPVFRNACAMPIMQIGELAKRLSPEFCQSTPNIPWKAIKDIRDLFAHDYRSMNKDMIWMTAIKNIPELKQNIEQL